MYVEEMLLRMYYKWEDWVDYIVVRIVEMHIYSAHYKRIE